MHNLGLRAALGSRCSFVRVTSTLEYPVPADALDRRQAEMHNARVHDVRLVSGFDRNRRSRPVVLAPRGRTSFRCPWCCSQAAEQAI